MGPVGGCVALCKRPLRCPRRMDMSGHKMTCCKFGVTAREMDNVGSVARMVMRRNAPTFRDLATVSRMGSLLSYGLLIAKEVHAEGVGQGSASNDEAGRGRRSGGGRTTRGRRDGLCVSIHTRRVASRRCRKSAGKMILAKFMYGGNSVQAAPHNVHVASVVLTY